jgi:pimeloyl-ACP methyl ester carboxylesterase
VAIGRQRLGDLDHNTLGATGIESGEHLQYGSPAVTHGQGANTLCHQAGGNEVRHSTIRRGDTTELGYDLAYEWLPGHSPAVVFLSGFASEMTGTKAGVVRAACAAKGQAMLRLDYSGHGASGGDFLDGSIGVWTEDAALVIQAATGDMPLLLIGSSMGGWIALLLARRLARVVALLLIAPAPDFTARLIEPHLAAEQREALARDGYFHPPSVYGPPAPISQKLLDDGRNHLLLDGPIPITCPVRILHGMRDPDVPWEHSLLLATCLDSEDVSLMFQKDGDHRLSRDQDLDLLVHTLTGLLGEDRA